MKSVPAIGVVFAGIVLLFIVLRSKAQNNSLLSVGDINSLNGDFSSDLTNLGRIVNRLTGSAPSGGSLPGAPVAPSPLSTGGVSCYTNSSGTQKCQEVPAGCAYEQPYGKTSLFLCCTRTNGNRSCSRLY